MRFAAAANVNAANYVAAGMAAAQGGIDAYEGATVGSPEYDKIVNQLQSERAKTDANEMGNDTDLLITKAKAERNKQLTALDIEEANAKADAKRHGKFAGKLVAATALGSQALLKKKKEYKVNEDIYRTDTYDGLIDKYQKGIKEWQDKDTIIRR